MISPNTIEAVRELSLVDVIGKYIDLKKVGTSYRAKSPFSEEKTPSFYVVPTKGFFKCFSSGIGGDHITFVMAKKGIGYIDAIKTICTDFGIKIEYEDNGHAPEYYDRIEQLLKLNRFAANAWHDELWKAFAWPVVHADESQPWRHVFNELIEKRKFTLETIIQWHIGYAPGAVGESYTPQKWRFMCEKIINAGHYEHGLHMGLIVTKNETNYDAFRNRIIYPVADERGQIRGFGGRALSPDEYNPKYLNSSDSDIFTKGKILYGLNHAGAAIRQAGYANLMEGYTDVISFHQAGITNTVGTCGTALTDDQCKLLKRYTGCAVLFVEDESAAKSALTSIDKLMANGILCNIVKLPAMVTLKESDEQLWSGREPVMITHRDKDRMIFRRGSEEHTVSMDMVESVEKIDPDDLVRFF